jgi:hypothetical protein
MAKFIFDLHAARACPRAYGKTNIRINLLQSADYSAVLSGAFFTFRRSFAVSSGFSRYARSPLCLADEGRRGFQIRPPSRDR